jgi:hypothetical protein
MRFISSVAATPTTMFRSGQHRRHRRAVQGNFNGDTFADITWANHANEWLQVTVLANANTHLASNTVFYFGNLVGATGYSVANSTLYVTPIDVLATLLNLSSSSVGITNLYDFNRDGKVNATDLATVILDESFSGLQLITTPS